MIVNADASPLGIVCPHIKAALSRLTAMMAGAVEGCVIGRQEAIASIKFSESPAQRKRSGSGLWPVRQS
jgi:hypothetical protein